MPVSLPEIDQLLCRSATEAKNRWGALVREARALGAIVITSHCHVEMVVIEAEKYRELAAFVGAVEEHHKVAREEHSAEFDRNLDSLQGPDAKVRVVATAAKGRDKSRRKAGALSDGSDATGTNKG